MKFLLFFAFLFSAGFCWAGCYDIQDADKKNFCLGIKNKAETYCYGILNPDKKKFCLALVSKNKLRCYGISNSDDKNVCLAFVP
ncbi:MAG: hypothetical protein J6V53_01550 [Alphaproteobacteria bacterium]|nr:hypothetical protein [Alphaproteobacteria bacterium]